MKHLRITNYKRFITSVTVLLVLVISLFNMVFASNEEGYAINEYTVIAGDTLWQIAEENKAEGTDIRKYIYELKELNNLKDCNIIAGQTIKIKKAM